MEVSSASASKHCGAVAQVIESGHGTSLRPTDLALSRIAVHAQQVGFSRPNSVFKAD